MYVTRIGTIISLTVLLAFLFDPKFKWKYQTVLILIKAAFYSFTSVPFIRKSGQASQAPLHAVVLQQNAGSVQTSGKVRQQTSSRVYD